MIARKEKIKELKTTRLMTKLIFHKFKVLKLERRLEKLGVKVDEEKVTQEKSKKTSKNQKIPVQKENKKYAKK